MRRHVSRDRFPYVDNIRVQVWRLTRHGRQLEQQFSIHNLITSNGKDLAISRLCGSGSATVGWLAVGTGSAAPLVGDTALGAEVFRDTITTTVLTSVGQATFTYYLGSSSANGVTLAEIGLFNDPVAGTMFARAAVSPGIVKNASKTVTFTWHVTNS